MKVIKNRIVFFTLSAIMLAASIFSLAFYKWNYSIEFTGGALLELTFTEGRDIDAIKEAVNGLQWGSVQVQAAGDDGVIIRTKDLTEEERQVLVKTASIGEETQVSRYSSYGPSVGAEMRNKSYWAITIVILGIMLYVAYAFRHVSKPVSSWIYGIATIVALIHDVLIPAAVYIMLGAHNIGIQIDILFVTALLTVLGFSVHDTIVVFDRTRENLKNEMKGSFEDVVEKSVSQTFVRSINTSLTVLFIAGALFFFGGETTKYFALTLGLGIIVGTYSSIFIASPILVTIANYLEKKK